MASKDDDDKPSKKEEEDSSEEPEATPVETKSVAGPSMTVSLFLTWILPILIIAVVSRFGVDTEPPAIKVDGSRSLQIDVSKAQGGKKTKKSMTSMKKTDADSMMGMMMKKSKSPAPSPDISHHPTSYQTVLKDIQGRKRLWKQKKKTSSSSGARGASSSTTSSSKDQKMGSASSANAAMMKKKSSSTSSSSQSQRDPQKAQLDDLIDRRRELYEEDASVMNAIKLADGLRHKDLKYHDGGMGQQEALAAYKDAIQQTLDKKKVLVAKGEATNLSLSGTRNVAEEVMFDYTQKSVDGLLCALYTNSGKLYFMANMFEKAVESYTECIDIEPMYLDAVGSRGSSLIILGKYEEAGKDFSIVIQNDMNHVFNDAFTGLSKVLTVKEEYVPGGWAPMIGVLEELIDSYEKNAATAAVEHPESKQAFAEALTRLHHVMYSYHDAKTKDREEAWKHLADAYRHKMSAVEPYNRAMEDQKLMTTKTVFHKNFWPKGIGSDTKAPIFIIGFVRSGSTLLERVLDAHPDIVGTGEDSVFNGRLDEIRNNIVTASLGGDMSSLGDVVEDMADSVVLDMRERWKTIDANTSKDGEPPSKEPRRFADKMLTNYFNVGFIHMLFPDALILHVARNPMDVLWSAYKHEFPPGGLDYTSEFNSLANMYHMYREVIKHWDSSLPGRITHVRYEDLVNDMPGMAKSIIKETGLKWDDGVLEFHKKKQAVNTLSTTQVRKGIYKHSMEAWKKYEKQLQPLVKLVGDESKWDLKTSLKGYKPPPVEE